MSTPPLPGKGLSVRVDDPLHDDLATLMRTGMTASDAVKYAVALTAGLYRDIWSVGLCPDGTNPQIIAVKVRLADQRVTPAGDRMTSRETRR
ncbi:hypothetical protein ACFT9I_06205 [Streptomyces sp. NPDC057137]|uniref:hypothetical protein n=1 Tax=Streptomyces sp. NPDC057137 TaxID=3346030 RepID=UPI00363C9F4E